jgi:hypothetical protein
LVEKSEASLRSGLTNQQFVQLSNALVDKIVQVPLSILTDPAISRLASNRANLRQASLISRYDEDSSDGADTTSDEDEEDEANQQQVRFFCFSQLVVDLSISLQKITSISIDDSIKVFREILSRRDQLRDQETARNVKPLESKMPSFRSHNFVLKELQTIFPSAPIQDLVEALAQNGRFSLPSCFPSLFFGFFFECIFFRR